ncbi:hypothetical protein [Streptomyces bohaiensis]|uniref:Uncharacterized protein n=1 Tax=Streptomyces bohaiensis TaxID=1431344 RepID=A0ABX1CAM0_9ACTN|nr:hypothetical protein [Streptomyces bohaiensis]NJQ15153.1 hypothetical protein [Streptomyces bohaiensis]
MLDEPRSGRFAAWGNALLTGRVSPDDAAAGVVGEDAAHRVVGLPGEEGPVSPAVALSRLRGAGVVALRVALPAPGDPLGLCGPPEFNAAALEAGEAVLAPEVGIGLLPEVGSAAGGRGAVVRWRVAPVRSDLLPDVPSLGEAERELTELLRETAEGVARLGLPEAGPVARAEVDAYRARAEREAEGLAPGYPPRAVRVLALAGRVRALVAVAAAPGGDGSLSAGQAALRAELIRPVERAARRARTAAYNAYAEEAAHGR